MITINEKYPWSFVTDIPNG